MYIQTAVERRGREREKVAERAERVALEFYSKGHRKNNIRYTSSILMNDFKMIFTQNL